MHILTLLLVEEKEGEMIIYKYFMGITIELKNN